MFNDKTELQSDVREFTGYTSTMVLSDDGLDTAYETAKRHIRIEKALEPSYDFYDPEREPLAAQDALFWYTCLFAKTETGELDAQDLQAGAVNQDALLAKSDNDVTTWFRKAESALNSIKPSNIMRSTAPARDREYEAPAFTAARDDSAVGGSSGDFEL
jgi:hypothetical protein